MFEMLEQKTARPRRWTKLVGLVVVAALIGSIILVESLWPQTLKHLENVAKSTIMAPLPDRPAPAEPPKVKPPKQKVPFRDTTFHAPPAIPPTVNTDPEPPAPPPVIVACPECVHGAVPTDNAPSPGPPVAMPPVAPPPPPPKVAEAPKPPEPPTRIKRGGDVQAANLVRRVTPQYPPLAKQARIQGVVHLTAVIARDGSIQSLQVLSGHPLLVPAALEAVRQWLYKPTTLNGQPVEVVTSIEVNFTLSQ